MRRHHLTVALTALGLIACLMTGCANLRGTGISATIPKTALTTRASGYTASLQSGGRTRTYSVHLPPAASMGRPLPLLLALHGRQATGAGQAKLTNFNALADADGFIVVYPDGYAHSWADGRGISPADKAGVDDVTFLGAVLNQVMAREKVDPTRVYVTGMSNGGFMTERLGCDLAQRFAAIAVVAANFDWRLAARCAPARPLPVLLIHGSDDPIVPAAGGLLHGEPILSTADTVRRWASLDGCGKTPTVAPLPIVVHDGTSIQRSTYTGCRDGVQVVYYDVIGGGHTWPGSLSYLSTAAIGRASRNLNASQVIWRFFQGYHL